MSSKTRIFISYSRADRDFVARLAADLAGAGLEPWVDFLHIREGARWDDEIEAALRSAGLMLVVLTPTAVESRNVRDEIADAIAQDLEIVPLLLKDCPPPLRLRRVQGYDFRESYAEPLGSLLAKFAPAHRVTAPARPLREFIHIGPVASTLIASAVMAVFNYGSLSLTLGDLDAERLAADMGVFQDQLRTGLRTEGEAKALAQLRRDAPLRVQKHLEVWRSDGTLFYADPALPEGRRTLSSEATVTAEPSDYRMRLTVDVETNYRAASRLAVLSGAWVLATTALYGWWVSSRVRRELQRAAAQALRDATAARNRE